MVNRTIYYLIEISFPLRGTLADIALALEFIIVFLTIQCFCYFLFKHLKTKKSRDARNLGWGIMFLGLSCVYSIFIIADFYVTDTNTRDTYALYAYMTLALAGTVCISITERMEKRKIKFFSIGTAVVLIFVLICMLFNARDVAVIASFVGAPLAILYFVHYFLLLLKMANYSHELVLKIAAFLLGSFFILMGYVLISDAILNIFGIGIRVVGNIVMIIGLNVFLYAIENLPDFSELDWIQKIRAILVIQDDGISLFSRFFGVQAKEKVSQEQLISGALSSIKTVLGAMVGNEKVNKVTLQDKNLLFEYRDHVIFVVIADEPLASLQIRIKQFADEFMGIFRDVLKNWNANVDVFLPTESVADRIFKPSESITKE